MNTSSTESRKKFSREFLLPAISLIFLIFVFALGWGIAIGHYELFPFSILKQTIAFVRGDPFEKTTLSEKIQNEVGGVPARFLHSRIDTFARSEYREIQGFESLFATDRQRPVFISHTNEGAYLMYGIFEFTDGRYGAMLLDNSGTILRYWVFEQPSDNNELNPVKGGFLPNGYVVSNAFYSLQVKDYCGNDVWAIHDGHFHHSVEPSGESSMWVFDGFEFQRRSVNDGSLEEKFSIFDIIAANPDLHIFEPRLHSIEWKLENLEDYDGEFPEHEIADSDPFHLNDITELPEAFDKAYPAFQKGDLIVSSRVLNLVFILRPGTRKVVWYTFGKTSRQHDPDFNSKGTITIFDNRNHRQFSRIIELNPATQQVRTLVDGAAFNLSNEAHGNHEYLPDGSVVFVDRRGRVLHTDVEGRVLFEFQNLFSDKETLELRNVHFLKSSRVLELERLCQ